MPQQPHDHPWVDASCEEQGGYRVPGVVQANASSPPSLERAFQDFQSDFLSIGRPFGWGKTRSGTRPGSSRALNFACSQPKTEGRPS